MTKIEQLNIFFSFLPQLNPLLQTAGTKCMLCFIFITFASLGKEFPTFSHICYQSLNTKETFSSMKTKKFCLISRSAII